MASWEPPSGALPDGMPPPGTRSAKTRLSAIGGTIALDAMFGGPISRASMNPARSLAPALVSGNLHALWRYLLAPIHGTSLGALTYQFIRSEPTKPDQVLHPVAEHRHREQARALPAAASILLLVPPDPAPAQGPAGSPNSTSPRRPTPPSDTKSAAGADGGGRPRARPHRRGRARRRSPDPPRAARVSALARPARSQSRSSRTRA